MDDIVVGETAQDVNDGVDLADVGEELVAQTLAPAGARDEAGDVDEFELGRNDLGRPGEGGDPLEPRIGHGNPADIGLDRAEREVGGGRRGRRGQRVEQRRFADIGQADDAAIKTHD